MADETRDPPGELPGKPRRADPRHTLRRAVHLRCATWGTFLKLYTVNISRGGMLLRSPERPEVGSQVAVRLSLPDGRDADFVGRVARVEMPTRGEPLFAVGVALELGPAERADLDRYLATALASVEDDELGSAQGQPSVPGPGSVEHLDPSERPTPRPAALTPRPKPAPLSSRADPAERPKPRSPAPLELGGEAVRITRPPARTAGGPRSPIVGIDFGTTTSSIGMLDGDVLRLFEDDEGCAAIPSVVWFRGANDHVVGTAARDRMAVDPARTVHSIKRLLGVTLDDPQAAPFLMSLALPGRAGPNRSIVFSVDGEELTPVQIAATILGHLKGLAEKALGTEVRRAVLAFPLAFGERQRDAVDKAARIAGLEVAALIPEPAAAAWAYGRGRTTDEVVAVYDFGGGTFDYCVLQMHGGSMAVLGAAGDPWLGGDDLDQALAKCAADEFWRATGIDVRKRAVEWQRVVQACEEAKRYLSMATEIDIFVPGVARAAEGPVDLSIPVTRERFETITAELVDLTLSVAERAMAEAGLTFDEVDELLLTGGSTHVPAVARAVGRLVGREPRAAVHPEQAVVIGAAIKAAELEGREVNPGTWPGLTLRQVAGRSVGLAMAGGVTEPLITRSTPLPAVARRVFSTFRDGQSGLTLLVVEGESALTSENRVVGRFDVTGLRPAPAGAIEVEVVFEMNDSGSLGITARDLTTGARTASRFQLADEP